MKHKVKGHIWNPVKGVMTIVEREFDELQEAIEFGQRQQTWVQFKVYDDSDQLIHAGLCENKPEENTYA